MSKNMIYGAGVLGIIATAVYIYHEHKKAKKVEETEQKSVIYIDVENPDEETKQEERKNTVTKKIEAVSHKIGKTVGTVALKIGARYPKIVKFACKYAKFLPAAVIGACAVIAAINKRSRWKIEENRWTEMDVKNDHGLDIRMMTEDPDKSLKAWNDTDLSKHFYQLDDLLKTMNFVYGEQYHIYEKQSFKDLHPEYDLSGVKDDYVIRQIFNTEDALKTIA